MVDASQAQHLLSLYIYLLVNIRIRILWLDSI